MVIIDKSSQLHQKKFMFLYLKKQNILCKLLNSKIFHHKFKRNIRI